tara:strand:+ start:391 stop:855 length:465 start_codon:yes stop_codon:yes gene_type:complete
MRDRAAEQGDRPHPMDHPSEKQPYEKPFVGPHAEIRDGHAGKYIAPGTGIPKQDTGRSGNPASFVMQTMMTTLENFSMMLGPPDPVRSKEGTPVPKWVYAMNNLDERVWCYAPDGIPSEEEIQNTRNPDGNRRIDAPLYPDGPTTSIQRSKSND